MSGRTSTPTTPVTVHEVGWDDAGYVEVVMDHDRFPKHRFVLGVSPAGEITGVTMLDRRFMARSPEAEPTSSRWGPVAPVTRRLLASVPLGDLERAARRRRVEDELDIRSGVVDLTDAEWLADVPVMTKPARRSGRPPKSDWFYARVAERYVELLATSGQPVSALAKSSDDELNLPTSRDTVKGWVAEARTRGLLTESARGDGPVGKAGGRLTPKARAILDEGRSDG